MALTFTTNQTLIANADSLTNYAFYRASGTGATGSLVSSTDFYQEGTASVSYRVQANWEAGILFDYYTANGSTTLDMSPTGRHLYMWWNYLNVAFLDTDANNGVYIVATSDTGTTGTPTNYSRWVIAGGPGSTSSLQYTGGWVLTVFDLANTPTNNVGTGANIAAIRRLGIGVTSITGTVKTENLYLDAMWYGQATYSVVGDGSNTATWSDFVSNSAAQSNGLFEDIGGAVLLSSGVKFGSNTQTNTTTFSDSTGTELIFKRGIFRANGGAVSDCIDYANLYSISADGTSGNLTSVTFGTVVGSGDNRQGVLGGAIKSPDTTNMTWSLDFSTNKANLANVKLYGMSLLGGKGGLNFDNDSGGTDTSIISTQFINCGEIEPGTTGNGAEILNCSLIDPYGGTTANRGLVIRENHNTKQLSCITSGNPSTQHMLRFPQNNPLAGTFSTTFDAIKFFGDYSSSTLWHGEIYTSDTVIDSYSFSNQDSTANVYSGQSAVVQTFVGDGSICYGGKFRIRKESAPTGNFSVVLYDTTGGVPTGNAIASGSYVISDLPTSFVDRDLGFDTEYTTVNANTYAIGVEYTGGDASNYLGIGVDNSAPTHSGNAYQFISSTWTLQTYDTVFEAANARITINSTNSSNPVETEFDFTVSSTPVLRIQNAVSVSLHVQDTLNNAIANARVGIYETSSSAEIFLGTTNGTGDISTSFNYSSDTAIDIRIRRSSPALGTRYYPIDASGTITSTGYSGTFTMIFDPTA